MPAASSSAWHCSRNAAPLHLVGLEVVAVPAALSLGGRRGVQAPDGGLEPRVQTIEDVPPRLVVVDASAKLVGVVPEVVVRHDFVVGQQLEVDGHRRGEPRVGHRDLPCLHIRGVVVVAVVGVGH